MRGIWMFGPDQPNLAVVSVTSKVRWQGAVRKAVRSAAERLQRGQGASTMARSSRWIGGDRSRRSVEDFDDPKYGDPETYYNSYHSRSPGGNPEGAAKLLHRQMERPFDEMTTFQEVLEVGAGSGEHFGFIRHKFARYVISDIRPESLSMVPPEVIEDSRVALSVEDAERLSVPNDSFDRVVATCVLAHLRFPEAALLEWRRVVRDGGVVTVYVPAEPGLALRWARELSTARAARKLGFQGYRLMQAREHINHAWSLDSLINHVFRHDEVRTYAWPISRSPMGARLFTVYQASILKKEGSDRGAQSPPPSEADLLIEGSNLRV